jgi:tetratricopeptide (TPR) repeat protein
MTSALNPAASDGALGLFSTWVQQNPTVDNYINRGNCYMVRGETDKALADFTAAIGVEPKNIRPLLYRAAAHREKKDFEKAIADLNQALALDPKNIRVLQDRGTTYLNWKEHNQEALADYTQIVQYYPDSPLGYMLRVQAYGELKQYDKALVDCNEMCKKFPTDAVALKFRCTTYASMKDYDNAIGDLTKLIALYPAEPRAFIQRSHMYFSKKDYDNALRDLGEALKLEPNNPFIYRNIALILSSAPTDASRNGKKALEFAIRSCELSTWKSPECLATLATSYAECGNFPDALKWQKEALKIGFRDKDATQKQEQRLKLYEANKPYRELD